MRRNLFAFFTKTKNTIQNFDQFTTEITSLSFTNFRQKMGLTCSRTKTNLERTKYARNF